MLQLPQRLRLDLTDTLARHAELLTHLFQGVVGVHADAEPHAQHTFFAGVSEASTRVWFAQVRLDRGVDREDRVIVPDEAAEMTVLFVADGRSSDKGSRRRASRS